MHTLKAFLVIHLNNGKKYFDTYIVCYSQNLLQPRVMSLHITTSHESTYNQTIIGRIYIFITSISEEMLNKLAYLKI